MGNIKLPIHFPCSLLNPLYSEILIQIIRIRGNRMHIPNSKIRTKTGKDKQTHLDVRENAELMKFLIGAIPSKSRSDIKSLLAHRQISVDNEVITQYNYPLVIGQEVIVNW